MTSIKPHSVPESLRPLNPNLWTVRQVDWERVGREPTVVSGASFVDPDEPYGQMGNPIAVVVGPEVADMPHDQWRAIANQIHTPETVFVRNCTPDAAAGHYVVNLTVGTPEGAEMGACAHGFLATLETLKRMGTFGLQATLDEHPADVLIQTTVNTSARAKVSQFDTVLTFTPELPRELAITAEQLEKIYDVPVIDEDFISMGVLSVGSPKLTIEVTPLLFDAIQRRLWSARHDRLLEFQKKHQINGIHIFCRDPFSRLPVSCIQNNAYSGPENFADRATGVSNAAQIAADDRVPVGQTVYVTQYSLDGPSARLAITKCADGTVEVGGRAALFNARRLR